MGLVIGCAACKHKANQAPDGGISRQDPANAAGLHDGGVAVVTVLGQVRGRVVSQGQPVVGARIQLGTAGHTREVTSGADGRFQLTAVPAGAYALAADAPGRPLGAFVPVDVGLGADIGDTELKVELSATAPLVGLVRDDVGKPLLGAMVSVEEEERALPLAVETGVDGRFSAPNRIRGHVYRVFIRRAGFLPDGPRLVRAGGAPVELGLRRGAILEGLVVDEHGAPVVGAEISIVGEEGGGEALLIPATGASVPAGTPDGWARLEASGELGVLRGPVPFPPLRTSVPVARPPVVSLLPRTDGLGKFRVAELPAGPALVTARHPDFADATSVPVLLSAGGSRSVRIELRRGAIVRGRVVDDTGQGLSDAQITTSDGRTALSDAQGAFQIEHVVRPIHLTARRTGYLRGEASAEPEPDQRELAVELSLRRALGRLVGEVTNQWGSVVSGARISVVPDGGEGLRVTSGSDGRFRAEGLPSGPYRVVVEHADYARLSLPSIEASDDARLLLRYGGGIDGELFDPRTGNAPLDAKLELVSGEEHVPLTLTGRRFRASGLPVGPARVRASARGYPTLIVDVDITESDRPGEVTVRDLRLELELGGRVRGRVRDDHGDPVAGATIDVVGSRATESVRSDTRGEYLLVGAPTGTVKLRARLRGRSAEDEAEVRSNEETRVDLTLPNTEP